MQQHRITEKINQYKTYKRAAVEQSLPIKHISFHKKIYPLLCRVLSIKRTLLGQHITVVNDKSKLPADKPVIYAVTHIGRYDFEMVMETLHRFFYALSGDWELCYGTIDDYFFRMNGVIWVDTEDKEDRHHTYDYVVHALRQGIPILWFPEGIWNLSDHLPMLNLYSGIIRAAIATGAVIIPIAVDQWDKEFTINIGENVDVTQLAGDRQIALRDILATLKWELWERLPVEKRSELPEDYWERFLEDRIREWPQFNMEIIRHREFRKP